MHDPFPKISIVTATYNQAAYIEDCILSILNQDYPNLEYIIIDGGSTDGTTDIIRKYEDKIHYWASEKDNGLYHALEKGLSKASGDIMGWLNSDDILHRKSLFSIAAIFFQNPEALWLQGYPTVIDESGRIVFHRKPCYSRYFFYLKDYHNGIFIQQESTYWRRELWRSAGAHISSEYKYAGDFELWMRFFRHAELYTTHSLIGAFRVRDGQLSSDNFKSYLEECDRIVEHYLPQLSKEEREVIQKTMRIRKLNDKYPLLKRMGIIDKIFKPAREAEKYIDYDFGNKKFIKSVL